VTDLRKLLDAAGIWCPADPDAGWRPMPGPNRYRVRANLPGGRTILCGASGARRDWVRDDYARLLGVPAQHLTVTQVRRPRPSVAGLRRQLTAPATTGGTHNDRAI
jgi:hypothetical protein